MTATAIFGSAHMVEALSEVNKFLQMLVSQEQILYIEATFWGELCKHTPTESFAHRVHSFLHNAPSHIDYVICFGGDGTLLRTIHHIANPTTPILAINSGHLGFLTDLDVYDVEPYVMPLLQGEFLIEERQLLSITAGDSLHAFALNEVAIQKRETGSMITVETYINEAYLADYAADGLIVATPSGSTAYAISVGGPIISPDCRALVLCPIAPHSLSMRPIVLQDDVQIRLKVASRSDTFMLVVDGNMTVLPIGCPIVVERAEHPLRLIKLSNRTFADTLRGKLLWGQKLG